MKTDDRATLLAGFDQLPDGALIDVKTFAVLLGVSENTAWRRLNEPDSPRRIRMSARSTRLRVIEVRLYIKSKG